MVLRGKVTSGELKTDYILCALQLHYSGPASLF